MKATRCCSGTLLIGLAASILPVLGSNVWAGTEYFPIPTASTTKNDGNDAGLIVPFLITTPEGELRYIVTPMMINNSIVGARGTINVFRYDTGGREMRFIASISETIERKVMFSYIDPALINGRYTFSIGASFFKNATSRFFGIGPDTVEDAQTNYTAREGRASWKFGVYLNEVTQIAIGQRFREVEIQRGATDLPFTGQVFPTVDGIQGATILGHRASFHYDTRDNLVTPTDGSEVTAYAELNQNFQNGDHPLFYRYAVDLKKLFPSESKRMILVVRANMQLTFGQQVPFYEQSSLGGQNNLRGYGVDRFIDDHLVVLNLEQRIHVLRARVYNVRADFEVAPFVDMGKVFTSFNAFELNDLKITPGVGFRGIIRPNVVGRVDYGYSNEGGAVFAGLDFPF
ncbi:MAG: BamA/TamA family outer membrane protein [Nitrospiraceae bacterium]